MKTKIILIVAVSLLLAASAYSSNKYFPIFGPWFKVAETTPEGTGDRFVDSEGNYFVDSEGNYLTGATP